MNKTPVFIKAIAMVGLLSGIIGLVMAIKVPGNVAFAPLFIGLVFALIALFLAKKRSVKCYGSYLGIGIVAIGLVISLIMQSKDAEIAIDEDQEKKVEQSHEEALDDIDDALDDLE